MPAAAYGALTVSPAFLEMIRHWAWTTFRLTAKIFFIIMALLTLLELLKAFGWIHPLSAPSGRSSESWVSTRRSDSSG